MVRKTGLMTAMLLAVCLMAADSVWACRFFNRRYCRCRPRCCCVMVCCPMPSPCWVISACMPVVCGPATVEGELQPVPAQPQRAPRPSVETPVLKPIPEPPAQPKEVTEPEPPVTYESLITPAPLPEEPPVEPAPPAMPEEPVPAVEPIGPASPSEPVIPETPATPEESVPATPDIVPPAEPTPEIPAEGKEDPFARSGLRRYRLWTDASGTYQEKARFVEMLGSTVRLQRPNGRYLRIKLHLLCAVDQRLLHPVATLAAAR